MAYTGNSQNALIVEIKAELSGLTNSVNTIGSQINNVISQTKAMQQGIAGANTSFSALRSQVSAVGHSLNTNLIVPLQTLNQTSFFGTLTESLKSVWYTVNKLGSSFLRFKSILETVFNMGVNVISAPFKAFNSLLSGVREGFQSIFKSFQWFQYQIFMQFMNIWLLQKTLMPFLDRSR